MSALIPLIADLHRENLIREAEEARRAKLAQAATPETPSWRRATGRAVDAASRTLATAARRLDPGIRTVDRTHLDLAR